ncbi:MAG: general secretion pathway protein GspB [Planctomycetota bacterium]|nr:general secretion pathway protein GspB [Planctomycetota bacterium]
MTLPPWTAKLTEPFRASPGKSWTLVVLAAFLVVMCARMLAGGHGPSSAQAAAPPVGMMDSRTLNDGLTAFTPQPSPQVNSLQQWSRQPIVPVHRNLFYAALDRFPQDDSKRTEVSVVGDGIWQQLTKSVSAQADEEEQRQVVVNNLKTKASTLKLESTMLGGQPMAMVNGEMVQEGSSVAGFRVLKIEARRMIIEREGIKLEIFMN